MTTKTMVNYSSPPKEDRILDWHYCYQGSWAKEVAPEAIAHPAKFARLLIKRIYEMALEEGWLEPGGTVLDMFGGTALGAKDALFNGINWFGIELEQHFVDIANGCDCTGVSKDDYVRFYGRWDKFNRQDGRYWCPECLAQIKQSVSYKEMPASPAYKKRRQKMVRLAKRIRKRLNKVDVNSLDPKTKELHNKKKKLLKLPSVQPMPLPDTRAAEFALKANGPIQVGLFEQVLSLTYERNSGLIPSSQPHQYRGNLERFEKFARYGARAMLVQGDSRRLLEIVGGMTDGVISSPVYSSGEKGHPSLGSVNKDDWGNDGRNIAGRRNVDGKYGEKESQLANLPEGDIDATISSPMFSGNSGGTGEASQNGIDPALFKRHSGSMNKGLMSEDEGNLGNMGHGDFDGVVSSPTFSDSIPRHNAVPNKRRAKADQVGESNSEHISPIDAGADRGSYAQNSEGQTGAMPEGDFDGVVSSPVYSQLQTKTGKVDEGSWSDGKSRPIGKSQKESKGYGESDNQFANLPEGDFDASLASPPFEDSVGSDEAEKRGGILLSDPKRKNDKNLTGSYGQSDGQLGLEKKDTFWNASRAILEQTFLLLKSGGVSIWVLKDYVRDSKIVEFSNRWRRLCEAVGFEHELMIRAWLTETEAVQIKLDGKTHQQITSKKSFFRRVHEKNGLPPIDWEIVLVMRKP